jgi:hypothetical protein
MDNTSYLNFNFDDGDYNSVNSHYGGMMMVKGVLDLMISIHNFSTRHRNTATKPPVKWIIEGNHQAKQSYGK